MLRHATLALVLAFAIGCGEKAADVKEAAQAALDAADYPTAIAQADKAIGMAADDRAMVWQSQQIKLQALARSGDAQTLSLLEQLAGTYQDQVKSPLYLSVGSELKKAGQTSAAIDVYDAGNKRFPDESETFLAAIQELQEAGDMDPAEIEKLKALGYL
jgi:tetratricopeptide (TPR) repeat protein